ncbi:MAG TPA: CBS domain-containing protein [Egibacteraceae bacterium]|nr:CBS domain-containing protein [Egibacteraceae bacterium]
MRVRDWMSPDPVTTTPAVTAADAGHVMQTYGIRHLPVILNGRVVGMLSDRDVRSAHPGATVGRVMSSPAHVVAPDDSVEAAARLLLSRRISSLPVVDVDGQIVGMITTTDCLLASLSATA